MRINESTIEGKRPKTTDIPQIDDPFYNSFYQKLVKKKNEEFQQMRENRSS